MAHTESGLLNNNGEAATDILVPRSSANELEERGRFGGITESDCKIIKLQAYDDFSVTDINNTVLRQSRAFCMFFIVVKA